jgi:hypothetical protein
MNIVRSPPLDLSLSLSLIVNFHCDHRRRALYRCSTPTLIFPATLLLPQSHYRLQTRYKVIFLLDLQRFVFSTHSIVIIDSLSILTCSIRAILCQFSVDRLYTSRFTSLTRLFYSLLSTDTFPLPPRGNITFVIFRS